MRWFNGWSNRRWKNFSDYLWSHGMAQTVKRLSTMQETRVQSLDWEDLLEKEMAIHSSTIAWKIPWTEAPGRLQSLGSQRVRHDWATSPFHQLLKYKWSESRWVVSDSLWPHGLYSSGNSPGQNTGVGSLSHLQGRLGWNPRLPHCSWILSQLSHKGRPIEV